LTVDLHADAGRELEPEQSSPSFRAKQDRAYTPPELGRELLVKRVLFTASHSMEQRRSREVEVALALALATEIQSGTETDSCPRTIV
jgi:hypothetical protein